jgi:hypothetical protein
MLTTEAMIAEIPEKKSAPQMGEHGPAGWICSRKKNTEDRIRKSEWAAPLVTERGRPSFSLFHPVQDRLADVLLKFPVRR